MIHGRFLLQKSYILVCGIVGAVAFFFCGIIVVEMLGLTLVAPTLLLALLFVMGTLVTTLGQRINPNFSRKQLVFDGVLAGCLASLPINLQIATFVAAVLAVLKCSSTSQLDCIAASSSSLFWIVSIVGVAFTFIVLLGAINGLPSPPKTSQ